MRKFKDPDMKSNKFKLMYEPLDNGENPETGWRFTSKISGDVVAEFLQPDLLAVFCAGFELGRREIQDLSAVLAPELLC